MLSSKTLRRVRSKAAGALLFLLPLPLLLKSLIALWTGAGSALAANGVGWLLFTAAAVLIRRGVQSELQDAERPLPLRRGRMLKALGIGGTALATAITAMWAAGHALPIAVVFGLLAAGGCLLLYGGVETERTVPGEALHTEIARVLQDAYARLESLQSASEKIDSAEFRHRLNTIVSRSDRILKHVAEDPQDLRRARKFLSVYLQGAQRVTEDYVRATPDHRTPQLEQNYRTLLVEIENACTEQYDKLMDHDVSDLEIRIEVLSARLRREGIA